eukprot:scaffold4174_cov122-Isochrysis_galbana.AAC.10
MSQLPSSREYHWVGRGRGRGMGAGAREGKRLRWRHAFKKSRMTCVAACGCVSDAVGVSGVVRGRWAGDRLAYQKLVEIILVDGTRVDRHGHLAEYTHPRRLRALGALDDDVVRALLETVWREQPPPPARAQQHRVIRGAALLRRRDAPRALAHRSARASAGAD